MNFNSILIGSDDPERLAAYYTKLLGEPMFQGGGFTGWQIGTGALTVGAHSEVHGKNPSPGRLIWNIEDSGRQGCLRAVPGGGRDRGQGAVRIRVRRVSERADRDLRGSRRQLLPAHVPDGDVATAGSVSAGTPPSR